MLLAVGGALWIALFTFSKLKTVTHNKSIELMAMTRGECVQVARNLLSTDAWLLSSPQQNLKSLKEACVVENVNKEAAIEAVRES